MKFSSLKKYFVLFFALLCIFHSCDQDNKDYMGRTAFFKNIVSPQETDTQIVCVTFNIHLGFKAFKDPWDKNQSGAGFDQIKAIAGILKQANPDIIALQEVPFNRYNAQVKDFIEVLAAEMHMNFAFGSHGYNDPYDIYPVEGQWGNAILSKYEITAIENYQLENRDVWERRSLLNAKLKINDSLELFTISLHHLPSEESIPNTADYISYLEAPFILMGDFNYSGAVPAFDAMGVRDVDSSFLKHGVDRIFISDDFKILNLGSLPDTAFTSDHPANFAILKLNR